MRLQSRCQSSLKVWLKGSFNHYVLLPLSNNDNDDDSDKDEDEEREEEEEKIS